ncbi:Hypothetical_protein [Hexamita inflata]|uniref:Hypothetical_protein n=1 Tax=Hexamita inflata TaxID=28002 RepID=A0AA86U0I7_9EUKA|nr:Hypothetical protein HINF_LOCUS23279 [Hexamita inflata]
MEIWFWISWKPSQDSLLMESSIGPGWSWNWSNMSWNWVVTRMFVLDRLETEQLFPMSWVTSCFRICFWFVDWQDLSWMEIVILRSYLIRKLSWYKIQNCCQI